MPLLTSRAPEATSGNASRDTPIILYSQDCAGDCDGAYATAILAAAHRLGTATIAAVLCEDNIFGAQIAYQTLQWAGVNAARIPIGYYQGGSYNVPAPYPYARAIAGAVWGTSPVASPAVFPSNLTIARIALTKLAAAGQKCIFFTAGPNATLADLLASPADQISPLTGGQLFQAAVRLIVTMGGNDHNNNAAAAEFNLTAAPAWAGGPGAAAIAQAALHALNPPIERLFVSFQLGGIIHIGPPADPTSPVSAAFAAEIGPGATNYAWDSVALLAALTDGGGDILVPAIKRGTCTIAPGGATSWSTTPGPDTSLALNSRVSSAALAERLTALYAGAIPPVSLPAAPILTVGTATSTGINVTVAPSAGGAPASYTYQLSTNDGATWTTAATGQGVAYLYAGLAAGKSYQLRAAGVNPAGIGPYSPAVTKPTPSATMSVGAAMSLAGATYDSTAAKFGQALATGYATVKLPIAAGAIFTTEFWFKRTLSVPTGAGQSSVVIDDSGHTGIIIDSASKLGMLSNGNTVPGMGPSIALGEWHHIVVVFDPASGGGGGNFGLALDGTWLTNGYQYMGMTFRANPVIQFNAAYVSGAPTGVANVLQGNPHDHHIPGGVGELDELVIWAGNGPYVRGKAFTPPSAPYTSVAPNYLGIYHLDGNGLSL